VNENTQEHWDRVYTTREVESLGWYEESPETCLGLVTRSGIDKGEPILDVGVGASCLVDALVKGEYTDIIGVDISSVALDKLRARIGDDMEGNVRLIVDDVTRPTHMLDIGPVSLWHDRAVLHFLLEDSQVQAYFDTLRGMVRDGGYVIIATFNLEGARQCSGLDIRNYDHGMIADLLGEDFTMLDHFDHLYHTPGGAGRPYVYTLSRRKGASGR
jgi:hypothetical protein